MGLITYHSLSSALAGGGRTALRRLIICGERTLMLKCSQWAPPSCMSTNGFDPVSIPVAQCCRDAYMPT